ncbi:unnamed protein product, partial [Medioppia subpectinata]
TPSQSNRNPVQWHGYYGNQLISIEPQQVQWHPSPVGLASPPLWGVPTPGRTARLGYYDNQLVGLLWLPWQPLARLGKAFPPLWGEPQPGSRGISYGTYIVRKGISYTTNCNQTRVNQTLVRWTQSADIKPLNEWHTSGDTSSATPPPAPPLTTDCQQNNEPKRVDQPNQVVAEEAENMIKLIPFTITNIVLTISSIVVYVWDVGSDVLRANPVVCIVALIGYGGNYSALV